MGQWVRAMREERYADAWALAAMTLRERDPATRDDPALPYHLRWVWDGRAFDGRHVLVRCYHGLGDTIQFARFLPLLATRAASVTLEVQPCLAGVLAQLPGIDRIVAFDPARPLPPAECDIEIGELGFALRATPGDAPAPYLAGRAASLPPGTVALCHGVSDWDPARSLDPGLFAPLCDLAPCTTVRPEPTTLAVINPQGCSFDLDETAALLGGASLVVTVDTMVAHLAGALGRPTWLLLKAEPDWRWNPAATGSPWYRTVRLYVQPRPGAWRPVIERVYRDLAAREAKTVTIS